MADVSAQLNINVKSAKKGAKNNNQIYEDAKKAKKELQEVKIAADNAAQKVKNVFSKGEVIGWAKLIKDAISGMVRATEKQSAYIENLNMMQIAFGKTADRAERYVQSIANAIGFDQSGLTRQLGIFRQISSAMGYTSDVADLLSTNLSKLSLDVASLYNVDIQRAGKALESAITGQVRSIRSLTGADITQATLQQEALALGIDKTISSMSRAEKTILIYLSLERQLANANGDAARTINSVANQTKIFRDQIAMAGRQIGAVFIPILKTLLPILNGILMVFNTIMGMLLSFFGIDASKMASEFGIASGGLDTIEDGLNGVAKASEKAKKSLRGFDKLNNITTPTGSAGAGGGGYGIGQVDSKLLAALDEYNLQLDKMRNKATEIRDRILEWLGFTQKANGEWEFTHVTIGTILTTLGLIAAGLKTYQAIAAVFSNIGTTLGLGGTTGGAGGGIIGGITKLGELIAKAFGIETVGLLGTFTTALLGVSTAFLAIWGTIELIKNVHWDEAFSWWDEGSKETSERIGNVHTKVDELRAAIDQFSYYGLVMSEEDYNAIVGKIQELKTAALTELDNWYVEELAKLDELYPTEELKQSESYKKQLEEIKTHYTNSKSELDGYVDEYTKKFREFYNNDKKISSDERLELLAIQKKFNKWSIDSLSSNVKEREKLEKEFYANSEKEQLKHDIEMLTEAKNTQNKAIEAANKDYNQRIKDAKEYYGKDTEEFKNYAELMAKERDKKIQEANAGYETFYSNFAESHQNILTYIDKETGTVFKGITDQFGGLNNSIEVIMNSINGVATAYEENILAAFDTVERKYNQLRKNIEKPTKYNIKASGNIESGYTYSAIPSLKADGGFVNSGEMFVARENGLTEYVGSFGNKTAVANNDQIVKGISVGVAKAMMAVGNAQPSKTIIEAKGDLSGLLNFISFEEKKQNRQYGL